ncbi:Hypothetical predicted protein [Cloeon dipterum]|uniref:Envelope fusion protein n=1 Tax=Cloeon dipterum TaxID=197152 RepID=A0A8S1BMZ7_9INSE|nr:Hypothetical predicted protein [Cloeon dipterum]
MRWLLLLFFVHAVTCDEFPPFNRGLFFAKKGEILASAETWTIQIPVNLKTYIDAVDDFKENLDDFSKIEFFHEKCPIYQTKDSKVTQWADNQYNFLKSGSQRLINMIEDVSLSMDNFSKNNTRIQKRGVLDFIGYGLRFLFGTAMDEDVQSLANKTSSLLQVNKMVAHVLENQTSLYNFAKLEADIMNAKINYTMVLAKEMKKNINVLRNNSYMLAHQIEGLSCEFLYTTQTIFALNTFQSMFDTLESHITSLKQAYLFATIGKLDPFFLPYSGLIKIITDIENSMYHGESILSHSRTEVVQTFYSLANINAYDYNGTLLLSVDFPIMDQSKIFTVYEPVSLPTKLANSSIFFTVKPEAELIAIDKTSNHFFYMSYFEFTRCQSHAVKVCYPYQLVSSSGDPSCLHQLFTGITDNIDDLCQIVTMKDFKPRIFRPTLFSRYIYSVPSNIVLNKNCKNPAMKRLIPDSINNTGTLFVPKGCSVHGKNFVLYQTNSIEIAPTLKFDNIEIPKVSFPAVEKVSIRLTNLSESQITEVESLYSATLEKNINKETTLLLQELSDKVETILVFNEWLPVRFFLADHIKMVLFVAGLSALTILYMLYLRHKHQKDPNKRSPINNTFLTLPSTVAPRPPDEQPLKPVTSYAFM